MSETSPALEQVLELAQSLSARERLRLIERLATTLEDEVLHETKPKRSLRGLWEGVSISAEDIDEARKEMWKNFPREDI